MTVEIQDNKDDNILMQSVIAIWKKERGFMNKGCTERKFKNKMMHVCEQDDYYIYEYRTFKRARCQGEKY